MSMPLSLLTGAAIAALSFSAGPQSGGKGPVTLDEMKAQAAARFEMMDSNGDGYLSEDDRPSPEDRFAMVDTNKNGTIEKDELVGEALVRFDEADTNGNGTIDEDERPEREGRRMGGKRRGDHGPVTRDDLETMLSARFDKLDTDGNGSLTQEEFKAAREGRRGGGRFGGGRMKGEGPHPDLSAIDTDGDGRISKAEHEASVVARFEKLDADKDGVVTDEERRAAYQGMKGKKKPQ